MTAVELPIKVDLEKVGAFCRERGIRRMRLFGSVLREDFNPERSDVDVVVEFSPNAHPGLRFFGYGDELAQILGHKVDFNTPDWLSKHFREDALRDSVTIYEQP
jgi:predicted nucleotidyltransferase